MSQSTDTVPGRFAGKTAIVTGAGSGIGRSTALRLAREGATEATLPSVATPEQVASAIAFLLSDDAANINGAILPCDGGWSAI